MRRALLFVLCWLLASPGVWAESSRDYDGTGDEIDFGNNLNVTTNDVSYCAYVFVAAGNSTFFWMGRRAAVAATDPGYSLASNLSENLQVETADGTDEATCTGTTLFNRWTLACGIWDSSTQTITGYKNGVSDCTNTNTAVGSLTNAVAFTSGQNDAGGNDAKGQIAYGYVYLSRQLTVVEMLELVWKPESIPASLEAFWPLWGSDSPEIDLSYNNYTGTVTNATASGNGPRVSFGDMLPL